MPCKKVRWTETGRGQRGSIFVSSRGDIIRARKISRTLGGLQRWELEIIPVKGRRRTKTVHLKSRRELRKAIREAF